VALRPCGLGTVQPGYCTARVLYRWYVPVEREELYVPVEVYVLTVPAELYVP